ncbi:hypothetical protein B0H14DRAFT_3770838 [Mycena olivaceomarginata]|nr:hypothetical protein B0H14DRAFT_3770838 [Mycena olivaceomarginata]
MQFFTLSPTRLGISGTKAEKRRTVNHSIRLELELYSPNPPRDSHLPVNHQGHNLSFTNYERGCYLGAGCWQPLPIGTHPFWLFLGAEDAGHRAAFAAVMGAVAKFSSSLSPFPVTSSVYQTSPNSLRLAGNCILSRDKRARRTTLPSSCSSPSPPSPSDSDDEDRVAVSDGGDLDGGEDTNDIAVPETPELALQQPLPALRFYNGGYGVFIWINKSKQPIYQLLAPRERDVGDSECIRGKLVLRDYQTALEAAGLPDGCILQRYIDPTGDWIEFDWDNPIELYLSNRILYLRLYGLDITPPDHILELFTLN